MEVNGVHQLSVLHFQNSHCRCLIQMFT